MIFTPNASLRDRFLDILFTLASFLLPILSVLSLVLNYHINYVLNKIISGYQEAADASVHRGITARAPGNAKLEYNDSITTHINTAGMIGLCAGFSAVLFWWAASVNPKDSAAGTILKEPLPRGLADTLFANIFQAFLHSVSMTVRLFSMERDLYQPSCKMLMNDEGHQIARCTPESAACCLLGWNGVRGEWIPYTSLCWEAKITRWCMPGMLICACVLVRFYGPQELRRRRAMRFWLWEDSQTREILKADAGSKEKLGERTVEHDIAEARKGTEITQ